MSRGLRALTEISAGTLLRARQSSKPGHDLVWAAGEGSEEVIFKLSPKKI